MINAKISGCGVFTPPHEISNEELVKCFNTFVDQENAKNPSESLQHSNADFIAQASGIRQRYVIDKQGILDPMRMCPRIPSRAPSEPSLQVEMGLSACQNALEEAGLSVKDIDGVILACSNMQRAYPSMGVELLHYLGCEGFAFDVNVACSSATFGIATAATMIQSGQAKSILVVSPEICTAHLNFRDRDSHFIFGDAASAVVVQSPELCTNPNSFSLLGSKLKCQYSNNIRNNQGFLNRCESDSGEITSQLFTQNGRKVFKEVIPMVVNEIETLLDIHQLEPNNLSTLWLHQANLSMNQLIAKRLLGPETNAKTPTILDHYGNTSSCGSIIAFHSNRDLKPGDLGVLCAFGAGYSVGALLLKKD